MTNPDSPVLLFASDLGHPPSFSHQVAVQVLDRCIALAAQTPFQWTFIDKPMENQLVCMFAPAADTSQPPPFPNDGIRWTSQEMTLKHPLASRELEISEIQHGFVPGVDNMAWRTRTRYRWVKGGAAQLFLIHYGRRQNPPPVDRSIAMIPVRNYPLSVVEEPAVYVGGERAGQRVPRTAPPPHQQQQQQQQPHQPRHMGGPSRGPGPPQDARAMIIQQAAAMGITPQEFIARLDVQTASRMGISPATLAQQKSQAMVALDRRRQEAVALNAQQHREQPLPEEEDIYEDTDMISTKVLAMARYKRNHDFMAEVFQYAAFPGDQSLPQSVAPYSMFNEAEIEAKTAKLTAEIEKLKSKSNRAMVS